MHEGMRRLAIVLSFCGGLGGAYYANGTSFRDLQAHRWGSAYFQERRQMHPKAILEKEGDGRYGRLYLIEVTWIPPRAELGTEEAPISHYWMSRPFYRCRSYGIACPEDGLIYRETFRYDADSPVEWYEYVNPLVPIAIGFVMPFVFLYAITWVRQGFARN